MIFFKTPNECFISLSHLDKKKSLRKISILLQDFKHFQYEFILSIGIYTQ